MLSYCVSTTSAAHLSLHGLKGADCALGFTGVLTEPASPLQNQSKIDSPLMQGVRVTYCFSRETAKFLSGERGKGKCIKRSDSVSIVSLRKVTTDLNKSRSI